MQDYQLAWMFFRDNLRRRTYPEEVAMELLAYCYPPYIRKGTGAKKWAIYRQIVDLDINVPLLLLMLLKVIPGFDSKDGDVEDMASQYDRWLNHDCEIVRPFRQFEYVFRPNLYAITRTHIYIASENEREFYKVPRTAHEGFERIKMDDNVGTMTMNGRTYLVFDELLLYINASRKELKKYGIERVGSIE